MTRKKQRLAILCVGLALLGGATAMVLAAFRDNLVFFFSPTDLAAKPDLATRRIRIGGLVETQSVAHQDGSHVAFRVTDGKTDIAVSYDGILPDLFREGQGVVARGLGQGGVFVASTILAKHDEIHAARSRGCTEKAAAGGKAAIQALSRARRQRISVKRLALRLAVGARAGEVARQIAPAISRGGDLCAVEWQKFSPYLLAAEVLVEKPRRVLAQHPDHRRAVALEANRPNIVSGNRRPTPWFCQSGATAR